MREYASIRKHVVQACIHVSTSSGANGIRSMKRRSKTPTKRDTPTTRWRQVWGGEVGIPSSLRLHLERQQKPNPEEENTDAVDMFHSLARLRGDQD